MHRACTIEVDDATLDDFFYRVGNQIYKLLPLREEGGSWKKLLDSLVLELSGVQGMLPECAGLFELLSKLRGLQEHAFGMDFMDYRRTVFECCTLAGKVRGDFHVDEDYEG